MVMAEMTDTLVPFELGFSPYALFPLGKRAIVLTIAKLIPDSSKNTKSANGKSFTSCQYLKRASNTRSLPFSGGRRLFFFVLAPA